MDGEDFNVIPHEDVEDIDDEEDESQRPFYRPGLAGLLRGRMLQRGGKTPGKFDHLHPFTQVLSISTVDECVQLESETFPQAERCSREKVGPTCAFDGGLYVAVPLIPVDCFQL